MHPAPPEPASSPAAPSRRARGVFAAVLGFYLGVAIWLVWRTAILEPYSDMFDWLERYFRLEAGGGLGTYLWAPHNGHHMVWTFLILLGDIRAFGASSGLFLAIGLASLAGVAAMLAWTAAQAAGPGFRLFAAGGGLALAAMGCQVLDATADINTTYLHALVFAVAAILLAERRDGRPWRAAAALACALAAGLGSAAGLAVWPALLFGALRRRDWPWAAVVAVSGAAFGAVYLTGQPASVVPAGHAAPWSIPELFLNTLGLPWSRGLGGFGAVLGAAALAGSLAVLWTARRRETTWPRGAAAGFVAFSLSAAALAAIGRGGLIPADQPPVRYAVLLLPMQAGLWIALQPQIARAWAVRRPWMELGALAASAFLLLHQALMADYAIRTSDAVRQALADFHAGRRTPAMLSRVHPDLAKAETISARLRADGLYRRELRAGPGS